MGGYLDPVATATVDTFIFVNAILLCAVLTTTGVVSNVINLCVFWKHGLNNSMNISFFALTISSLLSQICMLWRIVCVSPNTDRSGYPVVFNEIKLLTAGWPNACFTRIVSWITVYITIERCFSITIPLKVKLVFTSRRALVVLAAIFVFNILALSPDYFVFYFDWKYYPSLNKSLIGILYRKTRPPIEGLTSGLNAILAITAFFTMLIFTTILIEVLKRKSRWRSKTIDKTQKETLSTRQKKTVSMVIVFASVMIVCYAITAFGTFVSFFIPEFSATGKLMNSYQTVASFAFLSHSANANINVLLFYRMSSKYKTEFNNLFMWSKSASKITTDTYKRNDLGRGGESN